MGPTHVYSEAKFVLYFLTTRTTEGNACSRQALEFMVILRRSYHGYGAADIELLSY
jgi:hypothetical protein